MTSSSPDNPSSRKVRVRFAPSPTGYLHVGGARTALFNWLFARRHGGVFALRIEDTDAERNTPEAVEQILDGLRWLGLDWDEGPGLENGETYFQSKREDIHRAYLKKLEDSGAAYRSYATPEETDAFREAEGMKFVFKRSRHEPDAAETKRREEAGEPYVLRLDIGEEGAVTWTDHVRGDMSFQRAILADLVLARGDGSMLYNFVCAVDDIDMAMTHVIRGEDHLTNTARQVAVYQALGADVPEFAHVPLILGPDKQRLSKRHGATSVQQYREEGYLPDAFVNFLALLGWSPGDDQETFTREELAARFDLDRVNKAAAVFDTKKLDWLNGLYIRERVPREEIYKLAAAHLGEWAQKTFLPSGEVEATLAKIEELKLEEKPLRDQQTDDSILAADKLAHEIDTLEKAVAQHDSAQKKLADAEWLNSIIELEVERSKTLGDFSRNLAYFFEAPTEYDEKGVKKFAQGEGPRALIEDSIEILETADPFDAENLEKEFRDCSKTRQVNFTKMAQPIRIALTGRTASPPLFDLLVSLGREECLARLKAMQAAVQR